MASTDTMIASVRALLYCAVLCLYALTASPGVSGAAERRIADVPRVIAVSDVHGAYESLLRTLDSAGIIDDDLQWSGAAAHLVVVGDLLDRGAASRKVMDLLMALEQEAPEHGGRVHVLLGNHEAMNLVGDLRYVSRGEYGAFVAEESAEEREFWFARFRADNAEAADEAALRTDFTRKAPPGFFAHRRAFRADGHYGKWLLGKPLLLVIGDTAFVHGGLSPMAGELGLEGVNERLRAELIAYTKAVAALNDAAVLSPTENFYYHPELLAPLREDPALSDELRAAIDTVIELNASDVHSQNGPLWYRGNVGCSPLIEEDRLDRTLAAIGARRVVIGHTPTVDRRVLERFGGRVVEIDTGMLNAAYGGHGNALIIEGGRLGVVSESGEHAGGPRPHPRRVGARDRDLTAADLERILAHGEIVSRATDAEGRTIVEVAAGGETLGAVFTKKPRGRGFVPELAAYELDRLLELDMVPVTVSRELDGDRGTLQFRPADTIDEARRSTAGQGGDAWCPLPDQWNAMYIFDALIFNPGRLPQRMNYSADNWQLLLSGHERSFSTETGKPQWLEQVDLAPGDAWQRALRALDDERLAAELGDVLDRRRLRALAKRRDALLQ